MNKNAPFSAIDELAELQTPYAKPDAHADELFFRAMAEADLWHTSKNTAYRELCDGQAGVLLPVPLLKQQHLSTPVDGDGQWLTSSGTGQKGPTKVFFDAGSMRRIENAMRCIFMHAGMFSQEPANFLLLSPDPRLSQLPGYATAFLKFTDCAVVNELFFAVGSDLRFDASAAWAVLRKWSQQNKPVFIFGLTIFFEQLFLSGQDRISFLKPVKGITGGGWKGFTQKLDRAECVAGLSGLLESPQTDIRDIYGMTEHPLHYLSCPHGHFHIPLYSRFSILQADGSRAPQEQAGLIALQNPFFAALPAHNLLTEDIGLWGQDCPCGEPLPYIRFLGRITAGTDTCAHYAAQANRETHA